jgi:hypothetical protein
MVVGLGARSFAPQPPADHRGQDVVLGKGSEYLIVLKRHRIPFKFVEIPDPAA